MTEINTDDLTEEQIENLETYAHAMRCSHNPGVQVWCHMAGWWVDFHGTTFEICKKYRIKPVECSQMGVPS